MLVQLFSFIGSAVVPFGRSAARKYTHLDIVLNILMNVLVGGTNKLRRGFRAVR